MGGGGGCMCQTVKQSCANLTALYLLIGYPHSLNFIDMLLDV